ncbi:MAG: glycosyltransferase family 4 protein [Chloroflexaceae bacterium]
MRIGLDARYVYDHFPGIGRYTANLAAALGTLEHGHTLAVLYNPALPNTRHDLPALLGDQPAIQLVQTNVRPFSLAEQIALPRLARALQLDLLHSPYYIKPYAGLPCPSVVTIYDLLGLHLPQTLSRQGRLFYRVAMGLAVRSSHRIITISCNAQEALIRAYNIPPERITVTPLAADARFCPQTEAAVAAVHAKYGLPARYLLYVGANKPHKNLERLVQAWACVTPQQPAVLLLAGHYDPRYPQVQQMAAAPGLRDRIMRIQNVAEADLPALYAGATAFVFPSFYEGFGLPPLEAMACGVPVICAHAGSLPEVVGDAAVTFDPYAVDELAAAIQRVLDAPALRVDLRERGLRRAQAFSWEQTARQTLAVYEALQHTRLM